MTLSLSVCHTMWEEMGWMDRNREMGMEIEHAIEYGVLIGVLVLMCGACEREKQKRSTRGLSPAAPATLL